MRIASLISRYLLGFVFLVFGLNGFLHFIPMQPMPGTAGAFLGALAQSNYVTVISLIEVVSAVLLLSNQYVPLGLTLIGPIVTNILLFHVLMEPNGLPTALVVVLLWFLAFVGVLQAFRGIFQRQVSAS